MNVRIWVGTAVVLAAAFETALVVRRGHVGAAGPAPTEPSHALEEQVEALRQELAEVRARPIVPQVAYVPAPSSAADHTPGGEPQRTIGADSAPPATHAEPTPSDAIDTAEVAFAAEAPDRSWDATAALDLRSSLSSHMTADSTVRSLECRMSACRVETTHRDMATFRAWATATLNSTSQWDGPFVSNVVSREPGEAVRTVAFFYRPGGAVPAGNQ
jgi:hypothetical protein